MTSELIKSRTTSKTSTMVSEAFRSVPANGMTPLYNSETSVTTSGLHRTPSIVRRVCGVFLIDERAFSTVSSNSIGSNASSKDGPSTSAVTSVTNHGRQGLVLGAVVLDKDSITGDELRRAIIGQLSAAPKNFAFLSKDGWPLLRGQESRVTTRHIITEDNCISIRQVFDKPRIGLITTSADNLGFVFSDYVTLLKEFRETIDELFKELRTASGSSSLAQPAKPCPALIQPAAYRFIDRNGWPVTSSQEDKLAVLDLIINQNVIIQMRDSKLHSHHHLLLSSQQLTTVDQTIRDNGYNENKYGNLQMGHTNFPALPPPDASDAIDSKIISTTDTMDTGYGRSISLRRRNSGSKKVGGGLTRQFTNRRKNVKNDKSSKSYPIMLSYARQEAAQHALDLKQELLKLGFQVYLDVHEIQTGTDWQDSLNEAVSNCVVFVPLVTPMYGKTQWTNREVKLADMLRKRIVPINFLDHWPPECLAIQFATTQYVTWQPADDDKETPPIKSVIDIKLWPDSYVRRAAKHIGQKVPETITKTSSTVTQGKEKGVKFALPAPIKEESCDPASLVVISAHPQQRDLVKQIRASLEDEGFSVWCSIDLPGCVFDTQESASSPVTPNQLPTITEDKETIAFSDAYKAIARRMVESKQRPVSLPPIDMTPMNTVAETPSGDSKMSTQLEKNITANVASLLAGRRALTRMSSQISDISALSSISPEKLERLNIFQEKVRNSGVVIVIASDAFFKSRTSQQHVYYCEHRKKVVIVKADLTRPPTWFTNLLGNEQQVSSKNMRYIEVVKGYVKRLLDPSSTCPSDDQHESKMQYLVRNMKKNLPYLGTCVYIVGSTDLHDIPRSQEVCKAIGTQLAEVKNVTLVTSGFNGVPDLVARAFKAALELKGESADRIVHVLPVKDDQDFSDKCSQNPDGNFEPMSYGKTLFLGESVSEREATLARLLDTCILIEGGPSTAREVEEFIWNDHFVIPCISTGGAAAGLHGVPLKIFESPRGVDERDWKVLSRKDATPTELAKAVVHIVVSIKTHIASHAQSRLEQKKALMQSGASKFKAKLRRSSKKRLQPSEKLDMTTANANAETTDVPPSPDKVLPINPMSDPPMSDEEAMKNQKRGAWKRVTQLMTFKRTC